MEKVKGRKIQGFTCDEEVLKFGHRVCVPQDTRLKEEILIEAHNTPYTVHPGATTMYQDLQTNFWWEGMIRDVVKFVQRCLTCQQVKAEHKKPPGLLMPFSPPE